MHSRLVGWKMAADHKRGSILQTVKQSTCKRVYSSTVDIVYVYFCKQYALPFTRLGIEYGNLRMLL